MNSRLEKLQRLADASPDDPFVHYGLGLEYMAQSQWGAAADTFARVLTIDPKYFAAHHQRARALIKLGRHAEARESLQAGIAAASSAGDTHTADEMQELLETIT